MNSSGSNLAFHKSALLTLPVAIGSLWIYSIYYGLAYHLAYAPDDRSSRAQILMVLGLQILLLLVQMMQRSRRVKPSARGMHKGLLVGAGLAGVGFLVFAGAYATSYAGKSWSGFWGNLQILKEGMALCLLASNTLLSLRLTGSLSKTPVIKPGVLSRLAPYLLLVATPLMQYAIHNRSSLSYGDLGFYGLALVGIPTLILLVGAWSASRRKHETMLALVLGLIVAHYSLPAILGALKISGVQSYGPQVLVPLLLPLILAPVCRVDPRFFAVAAAVFWVVNSAQAWLQGNDSGSVARVSLREPLDPARLAERQGESPWIQEWTFKPDIFLLIYDGYPNEKDFAQYGIDNQPQFQWMRDQGFMIYPNTYSQYHASLGSMSRVLDMDAKPLHGVAGPNRVLQILSQAGYRTHTVLSSFFYQDTPQLSPHYIYPQATKISQVFALLRGVAAGEFRAEVVYEDAPYEEWLVAKRDILKAEPEQPVFLYAHSRFPSHSQNSGRCLEDEVAQFAARLRRGNEEMRGDMALLQNRRRPAIVIIASDHGPHLTGDCLYLQDRVTADVTAAQLRDRYGVMLAVRWPTETPYSFEDPVLLQDVFFHVLAYLQQSPDLLQKRLPRTTYGYGSTLLDGMIQDGRVMHGVDRGRELY